MFNRYREMRRAKIEGLDQEGFTLIELLIVIIIMGILAAVVVFALGGVTGSSAVSACGTDAKTVEVGVQAYEASPNNIDPTNAPPANIGVLLTSGVNKTNAPLDTWPSNNTYYYIGLGISGTVIQYQTVTGTYVSTTANSGTLLVDAPATVTLGGVYVFSEAGAGAPGADHLGWQDYDTYATPVVAGPPAIPAGNTICQEV